MSLGTLRLPLRDLLGLIQGRLKVSWEIDVVPTRAFGSYGSIHPGQRLTPKNGTTFSTLRLIFY